MTLSTRVLHLSKHFCVYNTAVFPHKDSVSLPFVSLSFLKKKFLTFRSADCWKMHFLKSMAEKVTFWPWWQPFNSVWFETFFLYFFFFVLIPYNAKRVLGAGPHPLGIANLRVLWGEGLKKSWFKRVTFLYACWYTIYSYLSQKKKWWIEWKIIEKGV